MSTPLRSFIEVAPDSHFPIQNLPFGIFQAGARAGPSRRRHRRLRSRSCRFSKRLDHFRFPEFQRSRRVFSEDSLNAFLALGRPAWRKAREVIQHVLSAETRDPARRCRPCASNVFHAQKDVIMQLPGAHRRLHGFLFVLSSRAQRRHDVARSGNALMPNWKWLPVAYHGRASSIVVSGTDVRRPKGQIKPPDEETPIFSPTRALDYELETAFLIGPENTLGEPVPIDRASRPYLRHGPDERLERARHPGLGIPTARSIPGQEFLHQHLAVGCDAGSARTIS